jgi:hypothetical protein
MRIACSHPGKVGDALYSIPTIRLLARKLNCRVDFYTSSAVAIAVELFCNQECIDRVIIPPEYVIRRMDMGVQPWNMPIPENEYEAVFHLGFKRVPDCSLPIFIGKSIGIKPELLPPVYYDYEDLSHSINLPEKFYILDTRGGTGYDDVLVEWSSQTKIPVILTGSPDNALPHFSHCENYTGLPFHWTPYIMSKCAGFVGIHSSHLVLANGFGMPKVIPHDNKSWDMRHSMYSDSNHYLVNPTARDILEIVE